MNTPAIAATTEAELPKEAPDSSNDEGPPSSRGDDDDEQDAGSETLSSEGEGDDEGTLARKRLQQVERLKKAAAEREAARAGLEATLDVGTQQLLAQGRQTQIVQRKVLEQLEGQTKLLMVRRPPPRPPPHLAASFPWSVDTAPTTA